MIRWLAACGVLIVSTISAAEPRHRLIWHAPAGCPDEAALREAIERRLEMSLDAVELAIDVEVVATARGFEARIAHGASDETRTLDSASCDELTDAVSVVIARLATEARAAAVTPPPVPPPVPPPPPRARVETPVRIAPPSTVWNAGLRISGIAGTGGAPGIDAGGAGAGTIVAAPSLTNGFALEDYLHRPRVAEEGVGAVNHLFDFWSGRPDETRDIVDRGLLPWFTDPALKIRFWRPLSALTHVLDYTAWPNHPVAMHAQSLLWYAAFIAIAAALYRRFFADAAWVAALAAFLLAIDDAHGIPVGWLANRSAIIAGAFAMLALTMHDRWRKDGWRPGVLLAPAAFAASLLAGEIAIGALAFFMSYAVFVDRASLRLRALTLLPYAAVLAAWRAFYAHFGFGIAANGIYVDPANDPARFLGAFPARAAKLLIGALSIPPSDLWMVGGGDMLAVALGAVTLALIAWGALPILRADPVARFWALATALSIVPAAASEPLDRLLLLTTVGAMGLVASVVRAVAEKNRAGLGRPQRTLAAAWLVIHGMIAPTTFLVTVSAPGILSHLIVAAHEGLHEPLDIASRTLVVVNSNNILGPVVANARSPSAVLGLWRPLAGPEIPARTRTLAIGDRAATIRRTEDRVLRVHLEGGMLHETSSHLFRSADRPLKLGSTTQQGDDLAITITQMREPGFPDEIECRFTRSLDDPSFWWVAWNGKTFETIGVPAIGASATYDQR